MSGGRLRLLCAAADKFPPFRVDVAVLFGHELAGRGHTIDWVLQSAQPCARPYTTTWAGGRVWVGATDPGNSRRARLRKHLRALANDLRLLPLARRGGYHLIQVKDKFPAALLGLLAARLYGSRFVYWLSFPFPEESLQRARTGTARYPLLYRLRGHAQALLLYRLILPAADHLFVQSEQMRRDLAARGIPVARMTVVPMGVAEQTLAETAALLGVAAPPGGRRCLAYLGTLNAERHLDFLVRVLAQVVARGWDAELLLVGDGDDPADRARIWAEARRLGVEGRVAITGFLPRPAALARIAAADLCLSPFHPSPILASTSPTKLVEYLALGKAVVANDHPEQRLVLEESGAGLCVAWDEAAFAAGVCRLLADPERAATMGRQGRHYVEQRRGYRRIADGVEARYRWIVAGGTGDGGAGAP